MMNNNTIKLYVIPLSICFLLFPFLTEGIPANKTISGAYLGQVPPGNIPVVFAPGIVSTEKNEHSPAIFSKDGSELFWSYYDNGEHVIMYTRRVNGIWTAPVKLEYSSDLKDGNPFFSADWKALFFHSGRRGKREDGSLNIDFWYLEKENGSWSKAKLFDFPPNSERWQLYGCQAANGNFYFTSKIVEKSKEFQLYMARFNGESWEKAELMPEMFNKSPVNWTPYVNPDESYIVFSSDRGGNGESYDACDLYISFKDSEGKWTEPMDMGKTINTDQIERFPSVSPDGKYLFFVRGFGDVYWVSTDKIHQLKQKVLKK